MSIKAIFPAGVTDITVNGLHQWDYGQKLEIQADDLPPIIEVHFAYAGARDAVVRVCEVVGGVAETVIPDACLEQSSPVLAWIYVVDETAGSTVKTIILPIVARVQPQASPSEPADFSDKYTQLIGAVNSQVESLKKGDVTVAKALQADHATNADSANHATNADSATNATTADEATTADNAINATKAQSLTLAPAFDANYHGVPSIYPITNVEPGLYLVEAEYSGELFTGMVSVTSRDSGYNFIGDQMDCSPRFDDDYAFIISFECIPADGIIVRCVSNPSFNDGTGLLPITKVFCLAKYNI